MNKKENIQIFFIDPNHSDIINEKIDYKFSVMKLDEHREYEKTIGTTNLLMKWLNGKIKSII